MKKRIISFMSILALVLVFTGVFMTVNETAAFAAGEETEAVAADSTGDKAMAAGIVVGLAAAAGAIGMGIAVAKSTESMARQPEIAGKINSTMMLGMVFIETAIIYALVIAILIIFVL
ncbi:MAG: ATP synthase F0 subunit C [Lachnospiraceae bacterium]|jgi:F-type H+-transporting ATPase subunit c|nr:ATP synthase F0 subunit C [Lachnospiraceae bacterium]